MSKQIITVGVIGLGMKGFRARVDDAAKPATDRQAGLLEAN